MRRVLAAMLLALVTTAAYLPAWTGPFIFDDNIVEQGLAQRPLPTDRAGWRELLLDSPRGLGDATFLLNARVSRTAAGFRSVNVLMHVLVALTLWRLLTALFHQQRAGPALQQAGERWAWLIALLWAVHPLNTQAVSYVVQRYEVLMGLCLLLTLLATVHACADAGGWRRGWRWTLVAMSATAAGMLCKQVIVVAPVAVYLLDALWLAGAEGWRRWWEPWRCRVWLHGPLLLVVVTCLLFTNVSGGVMSTEGGAGAGFGLEVLSPLAYLLTQGQVIPRYLWLAIWPVEQCLDWGWPPVSLAWPGLWLAVGMAAALPAVAMGMVAGLASVKQVSATGRWGLALASAWLLCVGLPIALLVDGSDSPYYPALVSLLPGLAVMASLLLALGVCLRRGWRAGLPLLLFLLVLAPTSSILPIADLMVEHRMYIPLAAVLTLFAGALASWVQGDWSRRRRWGEALLLMLIVLGAGRAAWRNGDYRSAQAIWTSAGQVRPLNYRIFTNLAAALLAQGRAAEAAPQALHATALAPAQASGWINLAQALEQLDRPAQAWWTLTQAARHAPRDPTVALNRGNLALRAGQLELARQEFSRAVELAPGQRSTLNNLGVVLARLGRPGEAARYFRQVAELDPRQGAAWLNLANALRASQDLAGAAQAAQTALAAYEAAGDGAGAARTRQWLNRLTAP